MVVVGGVVVVPAASATGVSAPALPSTSVGTAAIAVLFLPFSARLSSKAGRNGSVIVIQNARPSLNNNGTILGLVLDDLLGRFH